MTFFDRGICSPHVGTAAITVGIFASKIRWGKGVRAFAETTSGYVEHASDRGFAAMVNRHIASRRAWLILFYRSPWRLA